MVNVMFTSPLRNAIYNFIRENPYCTLAQIEAAVKHLRYANFGSFTTKSNSTTVLIQRMNIILATHGQRICTSPGRGATYLLRGI